MTRATIFLLFATAVSFVPTAFADDSAAISAIGAISGNTGTARVCVSDEELHIGKSVEFEIPATTIFKDVGPNSGSKDDPATWRGDIKQENNARILTLKAAKVSLASPCAVVPVKRYIGDTEKDILQKAEDNRLYEIDNDILAYQIPAKKPAVEIGKLMDDVGAYAVVLTGPGDAVRASIHDFDAARNMASCLETARGLAAHLGRGVSGQTTSNVFLGQIGGGDVTMGCGELDATKPDLFVAWVGSASPPAATMQLIEKGATYLTGATIGEIRSETAACVRDARAPGAMELSQRLFRGVGLECQSFSRDGGGGSVTVYRRYGAYPSHAPPDAAARDALEKASAKLQSEEAKKKEDARAFARWYLDPATPKEVKTFVMMAARAIALNTRCPSAPIPMSRIGAWAIQLGLNPSQFAPDGKYSAFMTQMAQLMIIKSQTETAEEACDAAAKYTK